MTMPGSAEISVLVRGRASPFTQEIRAGPHRLVADEPVALGGADQGTTPYGFLLAALGLHVDDRGLVCAS